MTWVNKSILFFLVQIVTSTSYKVINDNWTQMNEFGPINSTHKGLRNIELGLAVLQYFI